MEKYNGAGYITVGIFSFILGAMIMFIVNTNYINIMILDAMSNQQLCGPPAPSNSMGLVDYRNIDIGEDNIIIHGPILISFIDPNTLSIPDAVLISPGGGSPQPVPNDPPPTL